VDRPHGHGLDDRRLLLRRTRRRRLEIAAWGDDLTTRLVHSDQAANTPECPNRRLIEQCVRRPLRHGGPERQHVEGTHPVALAGEAQAAEILRHDEVSHYFVGRLVDEDLTRARRGLKP
jgi:hypothetical protein